MTEQPEHPAGPAALPRHPLRAVVRVDASPKDRNVRHARLACGHVLTVHPGQRVPKVGKQLGCADCTRAEVLRG